MQAPCSSPFSLLPVHTGPSLWAALRCVPEAPHLTTPHSCWEEGQEAGCDHTGNFLSPA